MCMNILKGKKILLCGLCFCFTMQERSVSVGLILLFQRSKLLFCINSVVVFVSLFLFSKAEKKRWGSLQQKKNYNRGTRFFLFWIGWTGLQVTSWSKMLHNPNLVLTLPIYLTFSFLYHLCWFDFPFDGDIIMIQKPAACAIKPKRTSTFFLFSIKVSFLNVDVLWCACPFNTNYIYNTLYVISH